MKGFALFVLGLTAIALSVLIIGTLCFVFPIFGAVVALVGASLLLSSGIGILSKASREK